MSTSTTKLGLVKPVPTEGYDIAIPNANMDKVDQFATELTTGVSKFTKGAFDNTTTPVLASGQLAWDLANQTLRIATINGSEIQVGQEIVVPAVNRTGIAIPNGTLVQLDGADSVLPLMKIKPAIANGTVDAHLILGVATHTIANGTMGHVTFFGEVGAVNTTGSDVGETWAVGDVLFASAATPGKLTKVTPVAPNLKVVVGTVAVANVNGKILVRLNGGSKLGATDSNVQFTALVDKDLLTYNAATGVWENKAGGPIVASLISGAAAKATPVDADMVGLMDSAAPTVLKKLSWANIKATLKTYFDGLYNMVTVENVLTSISTTNALSANQGKVLSERVSTKYQGDTTSRTTDINTLTTPGYYSCSNQCTNRPENSWGSLWVGFISTSEWIQQLWVGQLGAIWTRHSEDSGGSRSWAEWTRVVDARGGTFTGVTNFVAKSLFKKENSNGEGGELQLEKSDTASLAGNVSIDLLGDVLRIFEGGASYRGAKLNIPSCGSSASSELYHTGNITISQTAPASALPEGYIHMVY